MAQALKIMLAFPPDDEKWLRQSKIAVPRFWEGHGQVPLAGDVLRVGGRQFLVQGRAWEHDGETSVLRVFLSAAHAQSDTVFG